uniref:Reticulon-like protein n=2 Tax=Chenopodium quinoa TaxID=63459 RepID=A0A803N6L9_CHEQI
MYLREEIVSEVGELARENINALVLVCRNVALGKDSRLFLRVAACLLMISVFGALTDIVTLCYMSLAILLTIPALYERYDDQIDKYMMSAYRSLQQIRVNFDYYITMIRKLDLEKFQ